MGEQNKSIWCGWGLPYHREAVQGSPSEAFQRLPINTTRPILVQGRERELQMQVLSHDLGHPAPPGLNERVEERTWVAWRKRSRHWLQNQGKHEATHQARSQ